jgi:SAM-dependent methyltransferase
MRNLDKKTVKSFGDEWVDFDQSGMTNDEASKIFKSYFSIFPFDKLSKFSEGFDMGCGSGRWAKFIAPKVGLLHCIDPSNAIKVAQKKLEKFKNVAYHKKSLAKSGLDEKSQDFGYSLGVLHHVPNTKSAINSCVKLLKPGAPFLLYIYYNFDNRPAWFRYLWILSNYIRLIVNKFPKFLKFIICDLIAIFIYYPISRLALILNIIGFDIKNFPLYSYRSKSFYVMRTDARDRFGTPLEKRFTKKEIYQMMVQSGLEKIKFKNGSPFWTAIGFKKR